MPEDTLKLWTDQASGLDHRLTGDTFYEVLISLELLGVRAEQKEILTTAFELMVDTAERLTMN
jgi:hypothetical protein